MPQIPQEVIDHIKRTINLVDYIQSRGVKLTKTGKEYRGLCPFHDDKSPSLHVSPVMNLWQCFACDIGGDVISFVERMDKVSFPEAVKRLVPELIIDDRKSEKENRKSGLSRPELLQQVFEFYHKTFQQDQRVAKYLKARGIDCTKLAGAVKLGFADGSLLGTINPELRRLLSGLGILTSTGRERFLDCVVFPLFDAKGQIVNLYGRHTEKDGHYFLPGEQRGLFCPPKETSEIILTEGIIDALTLLNHGYQNALAIYGVNGLTDDHISFFQQQRITRVTLCLDADDQGRTVAPKLTKRLTALGLDVSSVELPEGLDVNEFFLNHSKADFEKLLTAAQTKSPLEGSPALAGRGVTEVATIDGGFVITFDDRTYRILGMNIHGLDRLKVNLKVNQQNAFHIDSLDLYAHRAREQFIKTSARLLGTEEPELTREVNQLIDLLEQKRLELLEGEPKETDAPTMTEEEKKEALKFLKSKTLLKQILTDFDACGTIGEETAKLFGYLATVSRFLEKPLGVLIVSRSGAGKSMLQEAITSFVPPEHLQAYTRITGQSLFYKQGTELKYKVLAIAEEKGAEDAIYSIRTLQSDQHLTVAVTITDPKTGQKKTEEYLVEGPVVILITTTNPEALDFETRNRFVILTIDESREQTRRILERQREKDSLEGLIRRQNLSGILAKHHNAQRLLRPLHVVNPFHDQLTYPDDKLLMRRDHQKYLTLIKTVAFLHQYQRDVKTINTAEGEELEYIEVTLKDIEIANKLACEMLGRSLDELSPHTRSLLNEIKTYVDQAAKSKKKLQDDIASTSSAHRPFTRRELCDHTGWSYWQIHEHLGQLVAMEYLALSRGNEKNRCYYELLWDGSGSGGDKFITGLIDVKKLSANSGQPSAKAGQKAES